MEDLLKLADELGLTVIEAYGKHTGGYRPGERVIRLQPGMRRRVARSVLAHEIAHHLLEHRPTEFGPVRYRQERHANEWAAQHLIDHQHYIEVERLRDGHEPSMAHDLDVAPEILSVYRGMLQRLGDRIYFDPHMGAGMWTHRHEVA